MTWEALQSGADINAMPEFFGFLLEFINKQAGEASAVPDATRAALAARLVPFDMSVLGASPGSDVNAFVVTADVAQEYSLTTLSDLAPVATQLRWGVPPECATSVLCAGALMKYGVDISTLDVTELGQSGCAGEMVDALANGGVHGGRAVLDHAGSQDPRLRGAQGRPGHPANGSPRSGHPE